MWFNEFYSRDTNRKIRAVNKAKGERGEHLTTNPPFGYIKDPENPVEKQTIFYNTQPAIIAPEVFEKVQEIRSQRHHRSKTGKSHMFAGLIYYADCKSRMYYCTTSYYEERQDHFVCSTYRKNKDNCSAHFIRAVVLEQMVWEHVKEVIWYVGHYESHFRSLMESRLQAENKEALRVKRKQLEKDEKRIQELDRLFMRLYEDNTAPG